MARTNGMLDRGRHELDEIEAGVRRATARTAKRARSAAHSVENAAAEVADQATEVRDDLESMIASRPLASVAIAAGLGFLVAKLWR